MKTNRWAIGGGSNDLLRQNWGDLSIKSLIIIAFAVTALGFWAQNGRIEVMLDRLASFQWGLVYLTTIRTMFFMNLPALLWRFFLVLRYRPAPVCDDASLPTCTVLIPAYNEGRHVADTIDSVATGDYPPSKLQIISVDDGSADDTWHWIQEAAGRHAGRVEPIRLKKNCGKRRALYEGIMRSRADVIVTIDSDSLIEKDTLRKLVSPFVTEPNVGAVAGNVRVSNLAEGIIPKMLEVSFAFSFDFIRASQSAVNMVLCTPGALSAYRRDAVMKVLKSWMHQRFMGQRSNIGEDRAMTNLILKQGLDVRFQSDACVYTQVPVRYKGLCRMLLRWARSNIRETLVMARFIFTRFRERGRLWGRILFLLSVLNLLGATVMLSGTMACLLWEPQVFLAQILFGAEIMAALPGAFYAIKYRSTNAVWAFAYSLFWLTGLAWIGPWALLTPGNNKWLTRTLSAEKKSPSGNLNVPPKPFTGSKLIPA